MRRGTILLSVGDSWRGKVAHWCLGFDSPLKFTAQQIDLTFYVAEEATTPLPRECAAEMVAVPVPVTLQWEFYTGASWQPLGARSGRLACVHAERPRTVAWAGRQAGEGGFGAGNEAAVLAARAASARELRSVAEVERVMTNTARATQAITVRDEVLGGSDARPNQAFTTGRTRRS